jgi:ABC-2 type transport system permease protein
MTTSTAVARVTVLEPPSVRHLLRAYLTEARYESLRTLRAPAFGAPFLLIPTALYLLFGTMIPSSDGGPRPPGPYLFTAFTVMGIMGPALFGFGMGLALEREQGLIALKRALPMPKGAYLLAKMAMAVLFAMLVASVLAIETLLLGRTPLTVAQAASVGIIAVVGTIPFCAIGLFIGARVSGRAAPAFVNLVYLPLMYLSGLFFPMPESIRWVALFSPAFHLNQLALHATGTPSILGPAINIAALVGVTVLFTGLTARRLARGTS